MANWNITEESGTSLQTPVWIVTDVSGTGAAAGTVRWNATDLSGMAAAAAAAVWRATELSAEGLAPTDPSYIKVKGRDGALYPAYAYVKTPSGGLV